LKQGNGIFRLAQALTKSPVVEFFCKLTKQLKVLAGGFFWYNQGKHQIYRLVVNGIEVHALAKGNEQANNVFQAFQAAMGDGDALADSGGPQALTGNQIAEYLSVAQGGVVQVNLPCNKLKNPLLAGRWHVAKRQFRGKDGLYSQGCLAHGSTVLPVKKRLRHGAMPQRVKRLRVVSGVSDRAYGILAFLCA